MKKRGRMRADMDDNRGKRYSKDDFVILVYTCRKNRHRAKAVARTWAAGMPSVYYVTDNDTGYLPNTISLGDFGYNELTKKSFLMWKYVHEKFGNDKKWFLKIDDDSYLFFDNLIKALTPFNSDREWYIGDAKFGEYDKWKGRDIPWIAGGSGILMSRACLKRMVREYSTPERQRRYISFSVREDIACSRALFELGIAATHLDGFHQRPKNTQFRSFKDQISMHSLNHRYVRTLHLLRRIDSRVLNELFVQIYNLRQRLGLRRNLKRALNIN